MSPATCSLHGVDMPAVPRKPRRAGPRHPRNVPLAAAHRPKVYFTQSVHAEPDRNRHEPTRRALACCRPPSARPLVVEDDIFCDLQVKTDAAARHARPTQPRDLRAKLFQDAVRKPARRLRRLPSGHRQPTRRHKNADQHYHTQFTERLIYLMLVDGHYRKAPVAPA